MPRYASTPSADTPLTVTSLPSTDMVAVAVLFAFAKGFTTPPVSESLLDELELPCPWASGVEMLEDEVEESSGTGTAVVLPPEPLEPGMMWELSEAAEPPPAPGMLCWRAPLPAPGMTCESPEWELETRCPKREACSASKLTEPSHSHDSHGLLTLAGAGTGVAVVETTCRSSVANGRRDSMVLAAAGGWYGLVSGRDGRGFIR